MYLLLDARNDKHWTHEDAKCLPAMTGRVIFDLDKRTIFIDGQPTRPYTNEWTREELARDMPREALNLLCRNYGFIFFKQETP